MKIPLKAIILAALFLNISTKTTDIINRQLQRKFIIGLGLTQNILLPPALQKILTSFTQNERNESLNTFTRRYIREYAKKQNLNEVPLITSMNIGIPVDSLGNTIILDKEYLHKIENILTRWYAINYDGSWFYIPEFKDNSETYYKEPEDLTPEEENEIDLFHFLIVQELGKIKEKETEKILAIETIQKIIQTGIYLWLTRNLDDSPKNIIIAFLINTGLEIANTPILSWISSAIIAKNRHEKTIEEVYKSIPDNWYYLLDGARRSFYRLHNQAEQELNQIEATFSNIDGAFMHLTLHAIYNLSRSKKPFINWLKESSPKLYNYILMRYIPYQPTNISCAKKIEDFIQRYTVYINDAEGVNSLFAWSPDSYLYKIQ